MGHRNSLATSFSLPSDRNYGCLNGHLSQFHTHAGRVQFCESGRLTEYLCHVCSGPELVSVVQGTLCHAESFYRITVPTKYQGTLVPIRGPNQSNLASMLSRRWPNLSVNMKNIAVMAKDFVARHLCRFYKKYLNHCQLLQIQQFLFLNSINSLAKMNQNMM